MYSTYEAEIAAVEARLERLYDQLDSHRVTCGCAVCYGLRERITSAQLRLASLDAAQAQERLRTRLRARR